MFGILMKEIYKVSETYQTESSLLELLSNLKSPLILKLQKIAEMQKTLNLVQMSTYISQNLKKEKLGERESPTSKR